MRNFTDKDRSDGIRGFTLIEVIIATGILAGSVLAIIAFLGATGKATSETLDRAIAVRIADNVRMELESQDIDDLFDWVSPPTNAKKVIQLMATSDGERVRVKEPSAAENIDNDPETGVPPGISGINRYFMIEVRLLENTLKMPTSSAQFEAESAMLPLSIQVVWPYMIKTSPNTSVTSKPEQQSRYVFNTVILRKK